MRRGAGREAQNKPASFGSRIRCTPLPLNPSWRKVELEGGARLLQLVDKGQGLRADREGRAEQLEARTPESSASSGGVFPGTGLF